MAVNGPPTHSATEDDLFWFGLLAAGGVGAFLLTRRQAPPSLPPIYPPGAPPPAVQPPAGPRVVGTIRDAHSLEGRYTGAVQLLLRDFDNRHPGVPLWPTPDGTSIGSEARIGGRYLAWKTTDVVITGPAVVGAGTSYVGESNLFYPVNWANNVGWVNADDFVSPPIVVAG